jgi:hypothetical protein
MLSCFLNENALYDLDISTQQQILWSPLSHSRWMQTPRETMAFERVPGFHAKEGMRKWLLNCGTISAYKAARGNGLTLRACIGCFGTGYLSIREI